MVASSLRRSKLLDVVVTTLILVLFSLLPFLLVYAGPNKIFVNDNLLVCYTTFTGLAWCALVFGGSVCAYYCLKNLRTSSKFIVATSAESLTVIAVALGILLFGVVLLAIGETMWVVEAIGFGAKTSANEKVLKAWYSIFIVVALSLLLYVAYLMGKVMVHVVIMLSNYGVDMSVGDSFRWPITPADQYDGSDDETDRGRRPERDEENPKPTSTDPEGRNDSYSIRGEFF